jgi:hypothetical protein
VGRRTEGIGEEHSLLGEPGQIGTDGWMLRKGRVSPLVIGHEDENVWLAHVSLLKLVFRES